MSKQGRLNSLLLVMLTFLLTLLSTSLSYAGKKTVVWWTPYATPLYEPWSSWVSKAFMEANPDIELEVVPMSWMELNVRLLPSIARGNPPDTFQWMSWAGEIAEKGAVVAIDQFISNDPDVNPVDWFPGVWAATTYRGVTYGLPGETDSHVFYWNKNLFQQSGLDPEKPPRTWKEVNEYAEKLTEKRIDGSYKVLGFIPWVGGRDLIHYGWQKGGSFVDRATGDITALDPMIVEALEWEVSYADKYDIVKLKAFEQMERSVVSDIFALGNLAMANMGSFFWSHHDKYGPEVDYGMELMPTPLEGGRPYNITSPGILYMPLGGNNQEETYRFMSWYVRNAVLWWSLQVGDLVSRRDLVELPGITKNWKQVKAYEALKYSRPWPRTPVISILQHELNTARDEALFGSKSVERALERAQEKAQEEWLKIRMKFRGR